ncbi:hypothetical protein EXU85_27350 [Spirosoma sp. KCTC 42546]|uniref:hypothetical protein n=1 Tax=Spirosoma sp. KCTC 42546 TaxID=2520506 RepID=UPI00115B66F2|nr:hypothetical protein [Spirosoma sp. KCTC 42546]QDK82123.1 hypothetical protein EXU85_27350 [Spirosoma sp. KCTC 42546]
MANPYFDEVYPVTGNQHFDFSNYGLTIFRPDSILTADQLNLLFGFLLNQEQLTRTRLIGVGIVCGLKPVLNANNTITISAGCGVPSEGDLLSLDADTTYDRFADYTFADHPYKPFTDINGLKLWELLPQAFKQEASSTRVLKTLDQFSATTAQVLANMVVMVYLESDVKSADKCTGVACDAKGKAFQNQLRILLVGKADASALISTSLRQAAAASTRLPVLTMARVRLDDRPYDQSLQRFRQFLLSKAGLLSANLRDAYELIKDVDATSLTAMTVPTNALQSMVRTISQNFNSQYVYDWLKDLHDAYNEFREATCQWLVQCMPPADAFPKHLLVGELVSDPGLCRPDFRHAWVKSPAVASATDARQKAIWFYQRILKLIDLFEVPATQFDTFTIKGRGTVSTLSSLKITPDRYRKLSIDQRSMPFYYKPEMRNFWSHELAKYCRTAYIHSYHPSPSAPAEVKRPFDYQIETYPFYRIEGFLGAGILTTLSEILAQQRTYNLAFDVLALRADTDQLLITQGQSFDFADLAVDFDDIMSQIHCHEAELNGKINPLKVVLPMTPVVFVRVLAAYAGEVKKLGAQLPANCILAKLPLLQKLKDTYEKRKADFEANLTFGPFLLNHQGLEHGAGVPPGGTFVLVYKDPVALPKAGLQKKGGESIVIADFYLPYRCCGSGNGIQFMLPEPPPTLEMQETFCLNAAKGKIDVSPDTGSFDSPLVTKESRTFFFNPTQVGTHTLTYTVPGRPPVLIDVQVVPLPAASFNVEQVNETRKATFRYTYTDAKQLTLDFGDGSPILTIPVNGHGNAQEIHSFPVDEDSAGDFLVKLTATNGNCDQAEPFSQEISFTPLEPIAFPGASVVCFSKVKTRITATPEGGKFSSKTIAIKADTGEYTPIVAGAHVITYTLENRAPKSMPLFILPATFKVENVIPQKTADALVLTPIPEIKYIWKLNGQAINPEQIKDESPTVQRYTFKLDGRQENSNLELTFQYNNKPICNAITEKVL